MALASEHGFPNYSAMGPILRGAALIVQGQWAKGVGQIRQEQETYPWVWRTVVLAWLAEGYREAGQADDGLTVIAEALRLVEKNDERIYEAELWRLKGTLTLQSKVESEKSKDEEAKRVS